jgi:hypothetical protein
MCIAIIIINTDVEIVQLPVVDPQGSYSHGYKQHIPTRRMYKQDNITVSARASTP